MKKTDQQFSRILAVNFGQLGDVVLGLPALAELRQLFADSHITVLTGKVPDQIVKLAAVADEVIAVDRVRLRDGPKMRSVREIGGIARDIRRRKFDLAIDLHSLSETNILIYLSGARSRLLANRENRSIDRLNNFDPPPPREDRSMHLTERYFDVLRPLGATGAVRNFRFAVSASAQNDLAAKHPVLNRSPIGLFPGAGHPSRCWPLERFAELAEQLIHDGHRIAVILGPEEAAMKTQVVEMFPADVDVIDGLSIPEFVTAAAMLSVFVTNDTGPMHMAACSGAPVVLLLDGRAPLTYLPLTDDRSIVRAETIGDLDVQSVFEAVNTRLTASSRAAK